MKHIVVIMIILTGLLSMPACNSGGKKSSDQNKETFSTGSFGYDLDFLQKHKKTLLLQNGSSMVAVVPDYQGRVMTSSAQGMEGMSFGWLNYKLIESGESVPHFNNYGGEERFWMGPEGGQYSIFFAPGVSFSFDNWQVPAPIDSEPFELVFHTESEAIFSKNVQLQNYSYFTFNLRVDRSVRLISREAVNELTGMTLPADVHLTAYETENTITNTGDTAWSKKTGLLSVWILGQFISSPTNTVIVPFNPGSEESLGAIVNDGYFGQIDKNRLAIRDSVIFFKADGQKRGKIGLSPARSKNFLASYDSGNQVLTVVFFNKPDTFDGYVNSMWELQEKPFEGDVVNSYNDGPLDDGSQLGPFYELETSSPASELQPGKSLSHISKTIHLTGSVESLEKITQGLFALSLQDITNALGK